MLTLTDNNFKNEVQFSNKLVLVECWAEWCSFCKEMEPIVEQIESEFDWEIIVAKLNVDKNQGTVIEYGIRSMPTFLLFDNGRIIDRVVGAMTKAELTELITKYI